MPNSHCHYLNLGDNCTHISSWLIVISTPESMHGGVLVQPHGYGEETERTPRGLNHSQRHTVITDLSAFSLHNSGKTKLNSVINHIPKDS